MKGKKLIFVLYQLLKYVLYINIVLAGSVVVFQIINIFRPDKTLVTSYLGKFAIELNAKGIIQSAQNSQIAIYIKDIVGLPSLGIDSAFHGVFVLLFSLAVVCVTLYYNYQFYRVFLTLYNSVKSGTPFNIEISKTLKQVALFSVLTFIVGAILSIIKLLIINEMVFEDLVVRPVFDNQILNFLWFGISIYILNEIYKVGLELKKEQELVI